MTHKYYDVLGVSRDSSKDDIRRAYKRLAVQMHPDKGGDPEKFKELASAYEVLSDDGKRQQYDQLGDDMFREHGGGAGGGPFAGGIDPQSIFEQFFGGGGGFGMHVHPHGPRRKANHHHALNIGLDDAFRGLTKTIRVTVTRVCKRCKEQCYACQGKGSVTDMRRMGFFTQIMERRCDACAGVGYTANKGRGGCGTCNGAGTVRDEHRMEVTLPAGVDNEHVMVFQGLGEQAVGDDEVSGDLVVEVHIQEHPVFKRQGNHLVMNVDISFRDSIVGKDIVVPHFGGEFTVHTQDFGVIQNGKVYSIPGKGMNSSGDLKMTFRVVYPTSRLDAKARDELKRVFDSLSI